MVEKFSGYEVPGLTSDEALLDVHCGIGVGQIAIFSVGNNETRREMLFLGKPVDQVAEAETMAKNGEVAASPEAIALLTETCDVADNIIDSENPRVIAYRGERYFEPLEPDDFDDIVSQQQQFSYKSSKVMQSLKHQMSLYVHPAARLEGSNVVNAEIRSVFTIFIKPEIIPNITGDRAVDDKMLSLLNDIMNVTIKELDRFKGHLRQFIIDDKGVVLIATFGQRGATFPQMVTEKGLPATIAIYEALMIELDVRAKVGATFGKAYCGVVGGVKRHEFAILGPSVNLAARLMTSKDNPGILVDNTIRQKTCKRFDFLTYAPVKAKGYADLVPVFEPRSLIERQWNVLERFVGRENELNILLSIVKQMIKERNPTRAQFVLIDAHSGYGKSCLAMQAMYSIRRIAASHKKEAQVYKGVCEDSEQLIPFAVFRNILLSLLMKHSDDQYDYDSDISSVSGDGLDAEPTFMSDNLCRARLHDLCKEMKKSEDFVDVVGTYLLGLPSSPSKDSANGKAPSPNDLVDFVASIFLKYSVNGNLIVLALDDIQWMDSLSWEVLELLLKRGKNLFILCMSRPNAVLQKGFINRLRKEKKKKKASYFTEISLLPFTENDTRDLIALALDCEAQCVDDEVTKYLYDQSGGMPYFAQELITNIVKKDMLEWNGDIFQWRCKLKASEHKNMYTDLNELLLFRLDEMKSETRILLQVCAVLGFEFSLSEVILVQCKSKGKLRNKQIRKIHDLLKETDKERILVESGSVEPDFQNEKTTDSEGAEKIFRFSHAIWRNCVLGTMLKERKCDLHRSVAKKMENQVIVEDKIEPRFAIKLVHHWKACDEFLKAGIWARKIGVHYSSRLLLHQQAKEVCLNAIQMWKEKLLTKAQSGEFVAGFHIEVLNSISPEELECLGRLHIDVGKYYSNMMDGTNAHLFYRNCELILEKSSSVADLKNRTVFFTLYSGFFALIQSGVIQDDEKVLQISLAKKFVEQANIHEDPVHIARALAMHSLSLAGLGKYQEAIDIQKQLEKIYLVDKMSAAIIREYASDRAAQNYGYSVIWREICGYHEESEQQINFILNDLLPKMPMENVHNSMIILYGTLWVLKEKGMARKAEAAFKTFVYDRYYEFFGSNSSTFFFSIYEPVKFLLRLSGDIQEESFKNIEEYKDIKDWVMSEEAGLTGKIQTIPLCAMGRDTHSIVAEICLLLAVDQSQDKNDKKKLLEKGYKQALISQSYTKGKPAFKYAESHSERVLENILLKMV